MAHMVSNEFDSAEARKIARQAGYKVVGAPRAHKKHFIVDVEDGASTVQIDVHRDGRIVRPDHRHESDFQASAAKKIALQSGYVLLTALEPHKKHYVARARSSDGVEMEIDVHRDGHIVEHRGDAGRMDFAEADAKALVARAGLSIVRALEPHKKHYVGAVTGAQGGVIDIDVHADGRIVLKLGAKDGYSADHAREIAVGAGYVLLGAVEAHKKHFVAQAKTPEGGRARIDIHRDGHIVEH